MAGMVAPAAVAIATSGAGPVGRERRVDQGEDAISRAGSSSAGLELWWRMRGAADCNAEHPPS
jgi:hypothetical protein